PQPEAEPLPPLEDLLPGLRPTSPSSLTAPEIPGTVIVDRFIVAGSTIFRAEELADQLAGLLGRPITFTELLNAQTLLTDYYKDQGYLTSGAFIPPQPLNEGTVTVQIIEGRLEDVRITGLEHLKQSYIRRRLSQATQPPLNQNELLEALQLLQLDPLIETLSVNLSAGTRPGLSILELELDEAQPLVASLTLDNARSPSVGNIRRRADITHQNLLGFGDALSLSFTNTDGSNSLDGLSYTWPIDGRGGTIAFSHSRSRNAIIEDPFDVLDITSRSRGYQLTYQQPLHKTPNTELGVSAIASVQESQSFLGLDDIGGFPFSPGADNEGRTKVSALRLVGEYSRRSNRDVFAIRTQGSFGMPWFDASTSDIDGIPDSRFFSTRTQVQYLRLLAPNVFLLLRSDLQWTPDDLLSLEEFAIGGVSTVRGYRQDELIGDNGFFASAEVRFPLFKIPDWQTQLQLAPFFDIGQVWNSERDDELTQERLASVGMGLSLSIGNRFQARLDWGIPLIEVDTEADTLQEEGLHFTMSYQL
ncbi:MAG: ShlB/FhaC/HecB family hemolysin secretion/activation protein, partial [Spirulina sp. SIO3F2]|nr:ShlB/FhaC/HecB family hemolysin secretion/activation protein [Spirulina sp. SIO3F2]